VEGGIGAASIGLSNWAVVSRFVHFPSKLAQIVGKGSSSTSSPPFLQPLLLKIGGGLWGDPLQLGQ